MAIDRMVEMMRTGERNPTTATKREIGMGGLFVLALAIITCAVPWWWLKGIFLWFTVLGGGELAIQSRESRAWKSRLTSQGDE